MSRDLCYLDYGHCDGATLWLYYEGIIHTYTCEPDEYCEHPDCFSYHSCEMAEAVGRYCPKTNIISVCSVKALSASFRKRLFREFPDAIEIIEF